MARQKPGFSMPDGDCFAAAESDSNHETIERFDP